IDIIAGVTRDEGSLLSYWTYPELHGNFTEQEFRDLVQVSDDLFHGIPVQNVTDYYLRDVNTSDSQALKHAFYNYYGDILMKCPTYLLHLKQKPDKKLMLSWCGNLNFFSAEIMQMWTQFAKNGLPSTEWPTLIDHNQLVRVKNLNPHTDTPVMVNPFESTCDGLIDGTKVKDMCPQPVRHFTNDVNQSEDCLFLNIWTVSSQNNRSNGDLKAVMVYIHGGGFIVGSSFQFPDINGTALASHDLTIVTINYRLGFL
ncbi:unnamed protein product, partial [Oppiella nova]